MDKQKTQFILRPWKMDDLDNLVRFANNEKIACNLTDAFPHPYTRVDGLAFITANQPGGSAPPDGLHLHGTAFAIDVEGTACGAIGIFPQTDIHRKNAEMGYWLAEDYWGRGIVTQAVIQTIDYGFRTFDISRIFARPFSSNPASQRVLEKAGMKLEARLKNTVFKNGRFLDEIIYSITRPAI